MHTLAGRRPPVCPLLAVFFLASFASLVAQNTVRGGLQADIGALTPGGWPWPAADAGNPYPSAPDPYLRDRIELGKMIFFDEQLSTSNTMACATCHMPEVGGVDPRVAGATVNTLGQQVLGSLGTVPQAGGGGPFSPITYGFRAPASPQETRSVTELHVPTMIGAYMFRDQFWGATAGPTFLDGSGAVLFPDWSSLENQAVLPPISEVEMGHQNVAWASGVIQRKLNRAQPLALVVPGTVPPSIPASWLTVNYRKVFNAVFAASANPAIAAPNGVTRERVAMALATYMRTLVPDAAPIDTGTMTPQEVLGFDIFVASGCATCHSASGGPLLALRGGPRGKLVDPWDNAFSDGQLHNIFALDPTRDVGPVKTPTLRNVGLRNRFFHDGRGRVVGGVARNTIADIVDFYDLDQDPASGGPGGPFELRSLLSTSATLSAGERAAVIAFLGNALTDPRAAAGLPPFDHPQLYSDAVPFGSNHTRPSTPGGLWRPQMISDVPPLVEKVGGRSWWKIGVGSAGGGAGGPIIPPGSVARLWFGTGDTLPGPFYLTGATPLLVRTTSLGGFATANVPIVLTPAMIGVPGFLQWEVVDFIGMVGFSEAARFVPL